MINYKVSVVQGGKTFRAWIFEVICTGYTDIVMVKVTFQVRSKESGDTVFNYSYRDISVLLWGKNPTGKKDD